MDVVQRYLTLRDGNAARPGNYAGFLGGLSWAPAEDAVLYEDDEVFVFSEEIAQFIEGFVDGRGLVHFGHLLHMLELVRGQRRTQTPETARLKQAFGRAGRPLRNAGAFCAVLCRDVPRVAQPVSVQLVLDRLRHPGQPFCSFLVTSALVSVEQPPLGPIDFEGQFLRALQAYTDEELADWFRHGRGPVKQAGESLAREVKPPTPRSLAGALAALLERPRLAGARPFIAQLVSSLSLPPRRLAHQEIPVGGYADVTTHGRPDQILPSQFALDEWDFFRRFAERELLYFRREEPHARTKQDLVVLLDQGVRTWGDVRLVLAAAVLALGKQADRRGLPFLLAATSTEGALVDPLEVDAESLGRLVDASDLSANPGLALERVLEQPAADARDVVLLTHPRNLREEEVAAAARRVTPGTRLFTVALDGSGAVDLCEMRHGAPVKVRHFQVDWDLLSPAPKPRRAAAGSAAGWEGDVEPIGFPFRFGIGTPLQKGLAEFDLAGKWFLTVSRDGMLHAWEVDGSGMEILPRGMWKDALLDKVEAVLGVADGFVVAGRVDNSLVAMHYDFSRHACTARPVGEGLTRAWQWRYSPDYHSVIVDAPGTGLGYALDLDTGTLFTANQKSQPSPAQIAFLIRHQVESTARRLRIMKSPGPADRRSSHLYLDPHRGEIQVRGRTSCSWQPFTPLADGRPALNDCVALEAQCCGTTLAVKTSRPGDKNDTLRLFRGPEGLPLADYPITRPEHDFVLSADGRRLARQVGDCRMKVEQVAGAGPPTCLTRPGRFSQKYEFLLGEGWLLCRTGERHSYLFRWDDGPLELRQASAAQSFLHQEIDPARGRTAGVPGSRFHLPDWVGYDPQRFILKAANRLIAVGDRFGQVSVHDWSGTLICMFFAFRGQVAAWMPDGTCHGPASLTGAPATPGALEKIGRALREASGEGGGRP